MTTTHDVCITGAGPAGLSAALILGRCRRDVVVFDSGKPRNAASHGLHGYLTRDGTHPMQLRALAREEIARYPSVKIHDVAVADVRRAADAFEARIKDGTTVRARMLLLATGRDDELPARPGFLELYGRGVFHCPICDGWEHRDMPMVAYGRGEEAFEIALTLLTWSPHVTLCTDGGEELTEMQEQRLGANRIAIRKEAVAALRPGVDGRLEAVRFVAGEELPCRALFFVTDNPQKSSLPENLGCRFDPSGGVVCNDHAATDVPGLYVAGNVRCGLHLAITAAAEGVEAAVAINSALRRGDLR